MRRHGEGEVMLSDLREWTKLRVKECVDRAQAILDARREEEEKKRVEEEDYVSQYRKKWSE
jgi:hypothetical protein